MEVTVDLESSNSICHLVAIPHPSRSHINAMINLCTVLASKKPDKNFLLTCVVTEEWLNVLTSESRSDRTFQFISMPNVIPSESVRATNFDVFFEAVMTKMEAPFDEVLDRLQPPATVIIADTILHWVIGLGDRRNIPVASFFPMSAMFFSILHHLVQNGYHPVNSLESGDELVEYIHHLPSIGGSKYVFQEIMKALSLVNKAQYLLFGTVYEFEPQVVDILRTKLSFPIYTVGPVIPYFNLHDQDKSIHNEINYITWLDCQPNNSVLYIAFGSFLSVSNAQMDEFVAGLLQSGVKFFWVARNEALRLKESCGDEGLIVTWCDQLKVLCHPSIGAFWSHCGWNSVQEGVYAGVPFLTCPIAVDQNSNSKLIVEDWKIGCEIMKKDVGVENLVRRNEIAKIVREFMDLESDDGKEMRRRAKELQEICQCVIVNGGSSESNIKTFLHEISWDAL